MAGGNPPSSTSLRSERQGQVSQEDNKDPCDINFRTSLAGVRTSNTADLKINVELNIRLHLVGEAKTVVCIRKDKDEIVGVILSRYSQKLIDCMEKGNKYIAVITDFDYGHVEVFIRRMA